jgi:ABC-type anion transport system duplicated permease subunit
MGKSITDVSMHIIGLCILAIALLILAYIALKKMEYVSKKHGRLLLRWQ